MQSLLSQVSYNHLIIGKLNYQAMKFLVTLTFFLLLGSSIDLSAQKSLFNSFVANFQPVQLPLALDENFMEDRYKSPEKFKPMDPIFFEFIFDEKDKQTILAKVGGYENIREKIHHAFIGKVNLSDKFFSLIYAESIVDDSGDNTTYYLNTYDSDGELLSRSALAQYENIGTNVVWEGYVFSLDNIFKIHKVYQNPEEIQKLSKYLIKMKSNGKATEEISS